MTPAWYEDLAAIRLLVLDEKNFDRYQESEENIRLVASAGGKIGTVSGHSSLLDQDDLPAVGKGARENV